MDDGCGSWVSRGDECMRARRLISRKDLAGGVDVTEGSEGARHCTVLGVLIVASGLASWADMAGDVRLRGEIS